MAAEAERPVLKRRRSGPRLQAAACAWIAAGALAALCLLGSTSLAPAAAPSSVEDEVRAAFVYQFAKFTEWPDETRREVLCLGVLGSDALARTFERSMRGLSVRGRPVGVIHMRTAEEAVSCDVVYIAELEAPESRAALQRVRGLPVLTVGSDEAFLEGGGLVRLLLINGKMRFQVNDSGIASARVRLSSKLLSLAEPR